MCRACPPTPCVCTTALSREEAMVVLRRGDDGRPTVWCDPCIADLVAALNAGGMRTIASCCGHGERQGSIALADGRWLVVAASAPSYTPGEADGRGNLAAPHNPRSVPPEADG